MSGKYLIPKTKSSLRTLRIQSLMLGSESPMSRIRILMSKIQTELNLEKKSQIPKTRDLNPQKEKANDSNLEKKDSNPYEKGFESFSSNMKEL